MTGRDTNAINFRSATGMMNMFDFLYKMGVRHAHYAYSEDDIEDFIERTASPLDYGILGEDSVFGWKQWRAKMYFWLTDVRGKGCEALNAFLREAYDPKSVCACFYPLSFMFYTQGILDRMQKPVGDGTLDVFMRTSRVKLKDFAERKATCRKLSEKQYIGMLQNFAYEVAENEESMLPPSKRIGRARYVKFAETYWSVIAAYRAMRRTERYERKLRELKEKELEERIGRR